MQLHGYKIHIILLAMIIGLGIFLGGQWVYNKVSYKEPLETALQDIEAIEDYSINDNNGKLVIDIELDNPDNFMSEYQNIKGTVKQIVDDRNFEIKLQDNRDETLEEVYYDNQFVIQEAIARGNYREMADNVHDRAESAGVDLKVFMDTQYIYLHMEHNDRQLYEVINRNEQIAGASPEEQGEVVNDD